jgi:hypothetical protein
MDLWIRYVEDGEETGDLTPVYEDARRNSPAGRVPPMVKVLSIRPTVAAAKESLRRALVGEASSLGGRRADMISVAVSGMNSCRF